MGLSSKSGASRDIREDRRGLRLNAPKMVVGAGTMTDCRMYRICQSNFEVNCDQLVSFAVRIFCFLGQYTEQLPLCAARYVT